MMLVTTFYSANCFDAIFMATFQVSFADDGNLSVSTLYQARTKPGM